MIWMTRLRCARSPTTVSVMLPVGALTAPKALYWCEETQELVHVVEQTHLVALVSRSSQRFYADHGDCVTALCVGGGFAASECCTWSGSPSLHQMRSTSPWTGGVQPSHLPEKSGQRWCGWPGGWK